MEQVPPTYEDYTAAPSGSSLLEVEDGLTMNQRRGGTRFAASPLRCIAENLTHHMALLYALWFISFVIACVALGRANNALDHGGGGGGGRGRASAPRGGWGVAFRDARRLGSRTAAASTAAPSTTGCRAARCAAPAPSATARARRDARAPPQYMEYALYGDDVYEFDGHHYQVVGGNWVQMTWRASEQDAWGRCYGGAPGYLATVDSAEENLFLLQKMQQHHGYAVGNEAWIGATDMANEGEFAWLDGYMGATVFWQYGGPVKGLYSNFKTGEPDENGEEDCVCVDGNGGWNDNSCYKRLQYFFVEFDV